MAKNLDKISTGKSEQKEVCVVNYNEVVRDTFARSENVPFSLVLVRLRSINAIGIPPKSLHIS